MTVTNQFTTSEQQQPKPAKKDWATLYNQASSQIGKLIERQSHQLQTKERVEQQTNSKDKKQQGKKPQQAKKPEQKPGAPSKKGNTHFPSNFLSLRQEAEVLPWKFTCWRQEVQCFLNIYLLYARLRYLNPN